MTAAAVHGPTLLHLGAGSGDRARFDLPTSSYAITILVEADRDQARALMSRYRGNDAVCICGHAVAEEGGTARFTHWSLPRLNSLKTATGVERLYPGATVVREEALSTRSVSELVDEYGIGAHSGNTLVVETAGMELALLRALQTAKRLSLFPVVALQCGRESLYEGAAPESEITAFLQDAGYECKSRRDDDDPEFPRLVFRYNPLQRDYRAAMARNGDLSEQVADLKNQLAKAKEENKELQYRQTLMHEEMKKAEGQIGLIRDLLLREKR